MWSFVVAGRLQRNVIRSKMPIYTASGVSIFLVPRQPKPKSKDFLGPSRLFKAQEAIQAHDHRIVNGEPFGN